MNLNDVIPEQDMPVQNPASADFLRGVTQGGKSMKFPMAGVGTAAVQSATFTAEGDGAVAQPLLEKVGERYSIQDTGGVGDRSTENQAALAQAVANVAVGELYLPQGDFVTSSAPANPNGVALRGPGKILVPDGTNEGGSTPMYRQINTYADSLSYLVGKEYLYRAFGRLKLGPATVSAKLQCYAYGDSTVDGYVGSGTLPSDFRVENLIPRIMLTNGLPNVTVVNRGVSGTSWGDLNAIPDVGANTDLIFIKYGINDAANSPGTLSVEQRIAAMATTMREKLAAIRAATYGDLTNLAIVLVGPNSTNDSPNGRNEEWYEQVRNVYVQAARDYKCTYFDTYAYLKDSREAAGKWMDQPWAGQARAIHPFDMMNAWIWGAVVDACFPRSQTEYWASNRFTSRGGNSGIYAALAWNPGDYRYGQTWEFASAADGWPAEGILETIRNPDTYAIQKLYPLAATGRALTRFAASGTAWATWWAGQSVAITLQNSWANFGGGWESASAVRGDDGIVSLHGLIKTGTTAANTVLGILPDGYRPANTQMALAASSSGTPVRIRIDNSGQVIADSIADATYTSLGGISFKAA